jgi:hypothetical protein
VAAAERSSRRDLTIVGGDRYPVSVLPDNSSPEEVHVAGELQQSIIVCVWGFVESRDGVPRVVEAHGNVFDTFGAMDLMERALELGMPASRVREYADARLPTGESEEPEWLPFFLDDVDVRGTESLFAEAEHLADAVAGMLDAWNRFRDGDSRMMEALPIRQVRDALGAYERRWNLIR